MDILLIHVSHEGLIHLSCICECDAQYAAVCDALRLSLCASSRFCPQAAQLQRAANRAGAHHLFLSASCLAAGPFCAAVSPAACAASAAALALNDEFLGICSVLSSVSEGRPSLGSDMPTRALNLHQIPTFASKYVSGSDHVVAHSHGLRMRFEETGVFRLAAWLDRLHLVCLLPVVLPTTLLLLLFTPLRALL